MYIAKVTRDVDGNITAVTNIKRVRGRVSLPNGNYIRLRGAVTDYPAASFNNADPDNSYWEVVEDTVKKTREDAFKVARDKAKANSVMVAFPAMSAEQKKIIFGLELTDAEKDQINADFP